MAKPQITLFDSDFTIAEVEWQDMPEFVQKQQKPFAKMTVSFRCQEDLDDFAKRIGQKLTPRSDSIWHPELERGIHSRKRWK